MTSKTTRSRDFNKLDSDLFDRAVAEIPTPAAVKKAVRSLSEQWKNCEAQKIVMAISSLLVTPWQDEEWEHGRRITLKFSRHQTPNFMSLKECDQLLLMRCVLGIFELQGWKTEMDQPRTESDGSSQWTFMFKEKNQDVRI